MFELRGTFRTIADIYDERLSKNSSQLLYLAETFHHKCGTGFWICFWNCKKSQLILLKCRTTQLTLYLLLLNIIELLTHVTRKLSVFNVQTNHDLSFTVLTRRIMNYIIIFKYTWLLMDVDGYNNRNLLEILPTGSIYRLTEITYLKSFSENYCCPKSS